MTKYTSKFTGSEIDNLLTRVESELDPTTGLPAQKADKATTLSGYGITNAYTKTEVDTKLSAKATKTTTLLGYGITNAYTKTETEECVYDYVFNSKGININLQPGAAYWSSFLNDTGITVSGDVAYMTASATPKGVAFCAEI